MATRSKKVLKELADKVFESEKKTKKTTSKKKAEINKDTPTCICRSTYAYPGAPERSGASIMVWGSIFKLMNELKMDIDNIPAMAQLPVPSHCGTWTDGSERIATHICCCLDERKNPFWDFFQLKDGEIYHVNLRKMKPADLSPPPQTDKNTIRKNEHVN